MTDFEKLANFKGSWGLLTANTGLADKGNRATLQVAANLDPQDGIIKALEQESKAVTLGSLGDIDVLTSAVAIEVKSGQAVVDTLFTEARGGIGELHGLVIYAYTRAVTPVLAVPVNVNIEPEDIAKLSSLGIEL